MIRRSGRFNYKIIQDPGQMSGFADGVTGPTEGWKSLVESQRGRKMSFEDYKRATEKITDQSMNMLYGTRSSDAQGGLLTRGDATGCKDDRRTSRWRKHRCE